MTDEIITVEENPPLEPETPTEPEAPATNPSLVISLSFDADDGTEPEVYGTRLTDAGSMPPEQYAKQVSEIIERTLLMRSGVLPVLQKVETA